MNISISPTTQATFGLAAYDLLTSILNKDTPDFGTAINVLKVEPHFDDVENTVRGGDVAFESYRKRLVDFPYVKFSKQNRNLTLKFVSRVCTGADLQSQFMFWHPTTPEDELVFQTMKLLAQEFSSAVEAIKASLSGQDNFDLPSFIAWLNSRIKLLPSNNAEMEIFLKQFEEYNDGSSYKSDLSDINAMSMDSFWQLIDLIDSDSLIEGMDQHALEKLDEALAQHTEPEIKSFHNHLSNLLYSLDTAPHYDASGEPGTDGFLYVRCYVVAHGKDYYEKALNNPEAMPGELDWCEDLLYVASRAWAKATDDEESNFDESCTEMSYETGSNPLNRSQPEEEEEEERPEPVVASTADDRPEIFKQMVTNYQSCKSYKDNGTYVADNRPGYVGSFQTYFARPISYRFRWVEKRMLPTRASVESIVWTDGKDFHMQIQNDKLRKADHLVDMLFKASLISQGAVHMMLDALIAQNMQVSWTRMTAIKVMPDETINGDECAHMLGTFLHPDDVHLWINKKRGVLRRLKRKVVMTQEEADRRNDKFTQEGALMLFANMMRTDGFAESEIQDALTARRNAEPVKASAHHVTYDFINVAFDEELEQSLFSSP